MRNFFRWSKHRCQFNAQCLAGKALQFFAENNGVRTTGFHKFDFLRRETVGHIDQFFIAIFAIKFFLGRVDGQDRAGFDRVFLFQNRIAVIVQKRLAVFADFFHPIFQIDTNAARNPDRGQENR